jgi:hypothetical protein
MKIPSDTELVDPEVNLVLKVAVDINQRESSWSIDVTEE